MELWAFGPCGPTSSDRGRELNHIIIDQLLSEEVGLITSTLAGKGSHIGLFRPTLPWIESRRKDLEE
jgi:hypothetical protein